MPIQTAVLLLAGYGTRMFPISKGYPKEMLPVGKKTVINRLIEQLSEAGIENFILVSRNKENTTFDYFGRNKEMEAYFKQKNKTKLLDEDKKLRNLGNFINTVQEDQLGDGNALLCGIKGRQPEPYLVVFPDYLVDEDDKIFIKMMDAYRANRRPIIAMNTISDDEDITKYGVVDYDKKPDKNGIYTVKGFVEKPENPQDAPSNEFFVGYAIVTPEVIKFLEKSNSTASDGENRLADAFTYMLEHGKDIGAVKLERTAYDCGQFYEWSVANMDQGFKEEFSHKYTNRVINSLVNYLANNKYLIKILHDKLVSSGLIKEFITLYLETLKDHKEEIPDIENRINEIKNQ